MANNENLKKAKGFDKMPENINKDGRPKGSKNRSTIARAIMDMNIKIPEKILSQLKEIYPDMANNLTIEEAMAYIQATKAIQDKDTAAYKALMDSGYGLPKQEIDQNINTPTKIIFQDISGKEID
jgi:hypothetical protein